jgi:hypothetical protein
MVHYVGSRQEAGGATHRLIEAGEEALIDSG